MIHGHPDGSAVAVFAEAPTGYAILSRRDEITVLLLTEHSEVVIVVAGTIALLVEKANHSIPVDGIPVLERERGASFSIRDTISELKIVPDSKFPESLNFDKKRDHPSIDHTFLPSFLPSFKQH